MLGEVLETGVPSCQHLGIISWGFLPMY